MPDTWIGHVGGEGECFYRVTHSGLLCCRMKKLKAEMEGVVKELAENNHFLERRVPCGSSH